MTIDCPNCGMTCRVTTSATVAEAVRQALADGPTPTVAVVVRTTLALPATPS